MNTSDFEVAIRQVVEDWRYGKADTRGAMVAVAQFVEDWKPLERLSVVFPAAKNGRAKPIEPEVATRNGDSE